MRSQWGHRELLGTDANGNQRWLCRWTDGVKDDGSPNQPSKTIIGTEDDAIIFLAKMRISLGGESYERITVKQFWDIYYSDELERLAASTRRGYESAWNAHVRDLFGKDYMDSLTTRVIENRLWTIDTAGGMKNAYKLMRQMYNLAYDWELIEKNPMDRRIRLKRMPKYEPDVYTLKDIPSVMEAIRHARVEPVILVCLFGGLRREEACGLLWDDISVQSETTLKGERTIAYVSVNKAWQRTEDGLREVPLKTQKSERLVAISDPAASRLMEISSVGGLTGNPRLDPDTISKDWKRLCSDKGIKYIPLKNLRTTFATIQQQIGTDLSIISAMLGHSGLNTAYKHYLASNIDTYKAAAIGMGKALNNSA